VLDLSETGADQETATALAIPKGAPVVRLERLRLQGDAAIIYSIDLVPRPILPADLSALDWKVRCASCSTAAATGRSPPPPPHPPASCHRMLSSRMALRISVRPS